MMNTRIMLNSAKSAAVYSRTLSTSARLNYSVVGTTKNILHKANIKTGEVLAEGMEKAEKYVPHAHAKEPVKDAAKNVNKKTGEVLAEGMERAEKYVPTAQSKEPVKDAAKNINKKTGEVLAEGMEKAEKYVPTAGSSEHKDRVFKNSKGYKDLQDKGSKIESEQNRPEDGV